MKKKESNFKFYSLLSFRIAFVLLLITMYFFGSRFYKITEEILKWNYSPIIFLLLYFISTFFPIPFLTFVGAAIYPFWSILFYSIIGNVIPMTLIFYMSRWLGKDYIKRWEEKNQKVKKLDISLKKNAFRDVLLLRFFFIIPPEIVNLLAGLSRMKFKDYFLASFLGMIPVLLASIMIIKGKSLHSNLMIISSIIIFTILIIIPIVYVAGLRNYVKKKYHKVYHHGKKLYHHGKTFFNRNHGKK